MTERVQPSFPPKHDGNDEPDRPGRQDVGKDDDVSDEGAGSEKDGQRVKCTKKRPGDKLPGGEEG
jgi:hypothetical protein